MSSSDISLDEAVELTEAGAPVIDVRTTLERAQGYIPGSFSIPLHDNDEQGGMVPRGEAFAKSLQDFLTEKFGDDKASKLIMSCRSGARSAKACDVAKKLGYTSVYNLTGGFTAWQEAKKAVVKD